MQIAYRYVPVLDDVVNILHGLDECPSIVGNPPTPPMGSAFWHVKDGHLKHLYRVVLSESRLHEDDSKDLKLLLKSFVDASVSVASPDTILHEMQWPKCIEKCTKLTEDARSYQGTFSISLVLGHPVLHLEAM